MGSEGTDSHVASLLGMTGTKDEGAARRVVVPYSSRGRRVWPVSYTHLDVYKRQSYN